MEETTMILDATVNDVTGWLADYTSLHFMVGMVDAGYPVHVEPIDPERATRAYPAVTLFGRSLHPVPSQWPIVLAEVELRAVTAQSTHVGLRLLRSEASLWFNALATAMQRDYIAQGSGEQTDAPQKPTNEVPRNRRGAMARVRALAELVQEIKSQSPHYSYPMVTSTVKHRVKQNPVRYPLLNADQITAESIRYACRKCGMKWERANTMR